MGKFDVFLNTSQFWITVPGVGFCVCERDCVPAPPTHLHAALLSLIVEALFIQSSGLF